MKRRYLFILILVGVVLFTSGCALFEAVGNTLLSGNSGNSGSSGGSPGVGGNAGGSGDPLVGKWELWAGEYIYFFETSSQVEFMSNGTVVERDNSNRGTWTCENGKDLTVEEGSYSNIFTFKIEDGILTLIDEDGDISIYLKEGSRNVSGHDQALVGEWEYWSGDYIYFFGMADSIEFTANGGTTESDDNNKGIWATLGKDNLMVEDSDFVYLYTYEIRGDILNLTDEDGDKASFQKLP